MTPREREMLAALKRAATDLKAICDDDRGKIDPAFALQRVQAAIAMAEKSA